MNDWKFILLFIFFLLIASQCHAQEPAAGIRFKLLDTNSHQVKAKVHTTVVKLHEGRRDTINLEAKRTEQGIYHVNFSHDTVVFAYVDIISNEDTMTLTFTPSYPPYRRFNAWFETFDLVFIKQTKLNCINSKMILNNGDTVKYTNRYGFPVFSEKPFIPEPKTDTLNEFIIETVYYEFGQINMVSSYKLKNHFPYETTCYNKNGNIEYKIRYRKLLFVNFHKKAKWVKTYYENGIIVKTEKGKGRVFQ